MQQHPRLKRFEGTASCFSLILSHRLPQYRLLENRISLFQITCSICCCSVAKWCPIICDPMNCSTLVFPVFPISLSLLKLMSTESVMPSNHLIRCRPLLLLPSIFPSIRVFSNESVLHIRWPYWSFSLNISPSNEQPGLISFRMDWLDLLAVQGTLFSK